MFWIPKHCAVSPLEMGDGDGGLIQRPRWVWCWGTRRQLHLPRARRHCDYEQWSYWSVLKHECSADDDILPDPSIWSREGWAGWWSTWQCEKVVFALCMSRLSTRAGILCARNYKPGKGQLKMRIFCENHFSKSVVQVFFYFFILPHQESMWLGLVDHQKRKKNSIFKLEPTWKWPSIWCSALYKSKFKLSEK